MRKLIATLITATLLTFGLPAPAASAAWADCNFVMFDYGAWPGTGSYDSGKSIGLARANKNFGAFVNDPECASINTPYKAVISQTLASQGVFTWNLIGNAVPHEEVCQVTVFINGIELLTFEARNEELQGGFPHARYEPNPQQAQKISELVVPGNNEIKAVPDCSTIEPDAITVVAKVEVHEDSYGDFDGVSINDGDEFTNSRDVKLNISSSIMVAQIAVSNDGGFPRSQTKVFDAVHNTIEWSLRASTDIMMSRKVYVRFRVYDSMNDGTLGPWQTQTFSDDIILDTIAPTISKASFTTKASGTHKVLDQVSLSKRTLKQVQLTARDDKTGVETFQLATTASSAGALTFGYQTRPTIAVSKTRKVVYVRAKDGAGNWSAWKSVPVS